MSFNFLLLVIAGVFLFAHAEQVCQLDKTVLQLSTQPDYTARISKILTGICKTNAPTGEVPCEDKVKPLVNAMAGFSQMFKSCIPKESDGRHVLERAGFSNIPAEFLIQNTSVATPFKEDPVDPYSCGYQCTTKVMSECSYYCGSAAAICYADPAAPACISMALQCFYEVPACCTCGPKFQVYECSVCDMVPSK